MASTTYHGRYFFLEQADFLPHAEIASIDYARQRGTFFCADGRS